MYILYLKYKGNNKLLKWIFPSLPAKWIRSRSFIYSFIFNSFINQTQIKEKEADKVRVQVKVTQQSLRIRSWGQGQKETSQEIKEEEIHFSICE